MILMTFQPYFPTSYNSCIVMNECHSFIISIYLLGFLVTAFDKPAKSPKPSFGKLQYSLKLLAFVSASESTMASCLSLSLSRGALHSLKVQKTFLQVGLFRQNMETKKKHRKNWSSMILPMPPSSDPPISEFATFQPSRPPALKVRVTPPPFQPAGFRVHLHHFPKHCPGVV